MICIASIRPPCVAWPGLYIEDNVTMPPLSEDISWYELGVRCTAISLVPKLGTSRGPAWEIPYRGRPAGLSCRHFRLQNVDMCGFSDPICAQVAATLAWAHFGAEKPRMPRAENLYNPGLAWSPPGQTQKSWLPWRTQFRNRRFPGGDSGPFSGAPQTALGGGGWGG